MMVLPSNIEIQTLGKIRLKDNIRGDNMMVLPSDIEIQLGKKGDDKVERTRWGVSNPLKNVCQLESSFHFQAEN